MIKLIIFDLWKTLAYKDVHDSSLKEMLKLTGVKIPKSKFVKIFEESVQTKKWKSEFAAYKNLCDHMGIEHTKENVNLLMKIRDKAEAKAKLFPHTISMLKQLRKKGYKIGLVSNSSVFAVKQLKKKTNLLKYIDYPYFSYDVRVIKPDVKAFRKMLKKAKCRPEEAIMIGDKPKDDIIPEKKMGLNTILFKNYKQLKKDFMKFSIKLD